MAQNIYKYFHIFLLFFIFLGLSGCAAYDRGNRLYLNEALPRQQVAIFVVESSIGLNICWVRDDTTNEEKILHWHKQGVLEVLPGKYTLGVDYSYELTWPNSGYRRGNIIELKVDAKPNHVYAVTAGNIQETLVKWNPLVTDLENYDPLKKSFVFAFGKTDKEYFNEIVNSYFIKNERKAKKILSDDKDGRVWN